MRWSAGAIPLRKANRTCAAAAKSKDPELVGRLLQAIDPTRKEPERYLAEPYVLPGNVDGPDSPLHGRAGWTWYTGSAQWLHRVVCERVVGVRPEWDGMRFDPCLPPGWDEAKMTRPWRGATLEVAVVRDTALAPGEVRVTVDGRPVEGTLLPPPPAGAAVRVAVKFRT